jgi:hypothetical protein
MTMSQQKEEKSKEKVQVKDLPLKEKELTEEEAKEVRGGGGTPGGVANRSGIGEEIPQ